MADTELKTYRGNCHCGAFVYEVQLPEVKVVGECNCSICYRKGYLWVFPGSKEAFKIVKGDEDTLTEYTFNSKTTLHKFCPTCGTGVMAKKPDGPPGKDVALNVRTIQGIDTSALERFPFDGAAVEPAYVAHAYTGPKPTAEVEGGKLYTGGCHCGAVQLALMSKPIDETYTHLIVECNCSVCERGGYVWVYPSNDQVVLHGREEDIGRYSFSKKLLNKTFCKTCGVHLTNAFRALPEDEGELTEERRKWYERIQANHPVNIRVLDNFNVKGLKIIKNDGANRISPPYVNP